MKRLCLPLQIALVLLMGIAVGFGLLLGVYALPTEPMAANLRASVPALNGEWGREDSYEQLLPGYRSTQLDNSTDAAMLLAAVHESDLPPTVQVAQSFRYGGDGNAFGALLSYGQSGTEGLSTVSIARYWHGYLVFLKPLLCFFSYLDIRMLLSLLQGCLMAAVIAGLCRRGLAMLVPAFLLALLAVTPFATALSLQFSTVLCTFLCAMLALLYLPAKTFAGHGLALLFVTVGMATSYVDYLTYPIASFGMPMILCLFLFPLDGWKAQAKRLFLCGLCWCVGYFGMWAGKWVIAGAFGNEVWFWPNLWAKISERSSDVSGDQSLSYGMVLRSIVGVFRKRAYLLAFLATGLLWLAARIRRRRLPRACWKERSPLLALLGVIALLPFAWYLCTQNHSYNHAFFTSRALCVTLFAVGCALSSLLPGFPGKISLQRKKTMLS